MKKNRPKIAALYAVDDTQSAPEPSIQVWLCDCCVSVAVNLLMAHESHTIYQASPSEKVPAPAVPQSATPATLILAAVPRGARQDVLFPTHACSLAPLAPECVSSSHDVRDYCSHTPANTHTHTTYTYKFTYKMYRCVYVHIRFFSSLSLSLSL